MPQSRKFGELVRNVKKYYTGKPVPKRYQGKYGKFYDKDEAEEIAFAIASKKHWRT